MSEDVRYVRHNQDGKRYAVTMDGVVDGWVQYKMVPTEPGNTIYSNADAIIMNYTEETE